MLPDYRDIKDLIGAEPIWYDTHGVPRYQPFNPMMLGVYDRYAIYANIACQGCNKRFYVGVGYQNFVVTLIGIEETDIELEAKNFHYGDPPRHDGCAGDTMNCEDLYISEVWDRETRLTHLEGPINE